jgi:hypothetical protein
MIEVGATLLASTNQNDFMKTPGDWAKALRAETLFRLLAAKISRM